MHGGGEGNHAVTDMNTSPFVPYPDIFMDTIHSSSGLNGESHIWTLCHQDMMFMMYPSMFMTLIDFCDNFVLSGIFSCICDEAYSHI